MRSIMVIAVVIAVVAVQAGRAGADTTMRSPGGTAYDVPDDQVEGAKRQGWTVETPEQRTERLDGDAREERERPREIAKAIAAVIATLVGGLILTSIIYRVGRRPRRVTIGPPAPGERLYAPDGSIATVPGPSVEFALRDGYRRIPKIDMRSPDGAHVLVDEDQVPAAKAQGFWPMTASEVEARRQR